MDTRLTLPGVGEVMVIVSLLAWGLGNVHLRKHLHLILEKEEGGEEEGGEKEEGGGGGGWEGERGRDNRNVGSVC